MSLTYDEIDKALTDACADRDTIAADLRAAREEVERLRATVARLEGGHRRICARLGRDVGSDDPHVAAEDAAAALVMEAGGLRAELAEALATIANERGGGDPPVPGFVFTGNAGERSAWCSVDGPVGAYVTREIDNMGRVRWQWAVIEDRYGSDESPRFRDLARGYEPTARAAMRAAAKAVRGES